MAAGTKRPNLQTGATRSHSLDRKVGPRVLHKLLLFHLTFHYGDDLSGSTPFHVGTGYAHQLPSFLP